MYHLKMKFPTDSRVGKSHGEYALARECYIQELMPGQNKVHVIIDMGEMFTLSLPLLLPETLRKDVNPGTSKMSSTLKSMSP